MDSEVYSSALRNTLDELQKICPDIKNAFAITKNHELLAKDEGSTEETITRAVDAFREMLEKAQTLGGVEDVAIEGINGRLNVSLLDEIYLFTITSKQADLNYVNTVTHILIPTVLRVLEKLGPAPLQKNPPTPNTEPEEPAAEVDDEPETIRVDQPETINVEPETMNVEQPEVGKLEEELKPEEESKPEEKPESIIEETQVNQLIVEDLKGLLAPSDTVRIDSNILEEWNVLYENRTIEEADVETFGGKSTRCKVKPIKESKLDRQGKIQIPSKMQIALEVKRGELVKVKPAVE